MRTFVDDVSDFVEEVEEFWDNFIEIVGELLLDQGYWKFFAYTFGWAFLAVVLIEGFL